MTPRQIRLVLGASEDETEKFITEMLFLDLIGKVELPFEIPLQGSGVVLSLTRKGAEMLALKEGRPLQGIKYYTPSGRKKSLLFLEHTIFVTELALVVERLKRQGVRITQFEKEPERLLMSVYVKGNRVESIRFPLIPDALLRVEHEGKEHVLLVEVDRGTVNLGRMELRFRAYGAFWQNRFAEKILGSRNLRVVTIAPTKKRLENLLARVRGIEAGKGIFWFARQEDILLEKPENFLDAIWRTTRGDNIKLFSIS